MYQNDLFKAIRKCGKSNWCLSSTLALLDKYDKRFEEILQSDQWKELKEDAKEVQEARTKADGGS